MYLFVKSLFNLDKIKTCQKRLQVFSTSINKNNKNQPHLTYKFTFIISFIL